MRFAIADFAHKLCSKKQQNNQGVVSSFSAAYNKFSKKYYKIHQMDLFRKKWKEQMKTTGNHWSCEACTSNQHFKLGCRFVDGEGCDWPDGERR